MFIILVIIKWIGSVSGKFVSNVDVKWLKILSIVLYIGLSSKVLIKVGVVLNVIEFINFMFVLIIYIVINIVYKINFWIFNWKDYFFMKVLFLFYYIFVKLLV